jgi:hypothetical protein
VHGGTELAVRQQIFADFKSGKLNAITNCNVLTEVRYILEIDILILTFVALCNHSAHVCAISLCCICVSVSCACPHTSSSIEPLEYVAGLLCVLTEIFLTLLCGSTGLRCTSL